MGAHLILGGGGGIGSCVARRLAARGEQVAIAARSRAALDRVATETGATPFELDASDVAAVEACADALIERWGQLDGIVNCCGSLLLKPAHLTTVDEWQATLSANLTTAFAAVRAAARCMSKRGGGVVLMSSAAARIGLANHEAIAAAKGGVAGLALSAAATYAAKGIRVNVVAPGLVRTPLTERITTNAAALAASTGMHALGRIGEADEVAAMIDWLLDERQGWITGQVFGVDGGLATLKTRAKA